MIEVTAYSSNGVILEYYERGICLMSVDFDWLERCIMGRCLSDHEKSLLGIMMTEVRLKTGEAIGIEHESGGVLYLIHSGEGEVFLEWGGECMRLPGITAGAQLGDLASILGGTAKATLIARSDCIAYRIRRQAFDALLASRQALACDMIYGVLTHTANPIRALQLSQ